CAKRVCRRVRYQFYILIQNIRGAQEVVANAPRLAEWHRYAMGGDWGGPGFVLGSHHAESERRQRAQSTSPSRATTRRASANRTVTSDRPAVLETSTSELPDTPEPALTRQRYFPGAALQARIQH